MPGVNDYLPFAIGGGANVETQATYAAAAYVTTGRGSGILPSNVYNKIARQSSIPAYLLGQIVVDVLGVNAADDGNTATLLANLKTALVNLTFPSGRIRPMVDTTAAAGWIQLNDGTIGNAGSGATTRANADASALYTLCWNGISNTFCPVSTGRGASAPADFAALKTLGLPATLGRALASAGAGSGLTARALGSSLGEELHTMTLAELVAHTHLYGYSSTPVGSTGSTQLQNVVDNHNTTSSTGSTTPFNQMQPTVFYNLEIKL